MRTIFLLFSIALTQSVFSQVSSKVAEKNCPGRQDVDIETSLSYDGKVLVNSENKKVLSLNFKDGVKSGTSVYYVDGKVVEKRKHSNNYTFSSSSGISSTSLDRDENGVYPFVKVGNEDVAHSARFYQYVEFSQFKDELKLIFKKQIENLLINPTITLFADSELKELTTFDVSQLNNIEIVGLLTKNEVFVDKKRKLVDERIISFQPIARNVQTNQLEVLPAIYYPEVRNLLAKTSFNFNRVTENLDDMFFFHLMRGPVYQFTSLRDKKFNYGEPFSNLDCFYYKDYTDMLLAAEQYLIELLK